jgi:acetylornithine deacetylase/succinyl-diaminopimelate desuccinylase-like protein
MLRAAALALLAAALPGCAAVPVPLDEPRAAREAVELLRELIRIDTTNPPPPGSGRAHADETALLRRVAAVLAADGIPSEILESAPGRGNLVARVRGSGARPPLLLMAHVDVVGVDRSRWSADPFAAEVRNGFVWGRGALDDKDDAAVFVQALRLVSRLKTPLSRDLVLLLNADEESSGRFGAAWMVEQHWDRIACGAVISEGGSSLLKDGRLVQFGIQTAEKVYHDFRLYVRGESGHSSVPGPRNAIYDAARLLARLETFRPTLRIHETVRASLLGLLGTPEMQPFEGLVRRAVGGDAASAEELARHPRFNAQLRSTFVPTLVRGGIRENVLPPDVEVNFNARLLPGERIEDLVAALVRHLGLPSCDLVEGGEAAIEKWKRDKKDADVAVFLVERSVDAPGSPLDHEVYRALEAAAKKRAPGVVVVPRLATGATDLRFFRSKGVPAFGVAPCPVEEAEEGTPHHHDERVAVSSVEWGVGYVMDAIRALEAQTPK